MDPHHLHRLKEEQEKAITETKDKIQKCENFKNDYRALQERLQTLPDQVSHEVMVPFGKFAFMPGRLVHTNEVMVLLGDNWFAERSAKQAAEIAGRRIEELDKSLAELNKQMKLLVPRLGFTSELHAENQVQSEVKEIREEYNEEAERKWDARHRESARKQKEHERHLSKGSNIGVLSDKKQNKSHNSNTEDDPLWARLEELEKQESERRELESDEDLDELSDGRQGDPSHDREPPSRGRHVNPSQENRRVSFADSSGPADGQRSQDSDDDNDESSSQETDSEEDGNSGHDDGAQTAKRAINFSHSSTPAILPHQMCPAGDGNINSPADVYKLFTPPSILKKTSVASTPPAHSTGELHQDFDSFPPRSDSHKPVGFTSSSQKAFSGQIVERASQPVQVEDRKAEQPRKVSKFKAKRMEQR